MNVTESKLQSTCFQWHWNTMPEERRRLILIHNNPRNAIAGALLKGMGMQEGSADLLYMRKIPELLGGVEKLLITDKYGEVMDISRFVLPHWLECKLPDGYQSKAQKVFQKDVEALGMKYDIFKTFEEFQRLIKTGRR